MHNVGKENTSEDYKIAHNIVIDIKMVNNEKRTVWVSKD